MSTVRNWVVDIEIDEQGDERVTRAEARLHTHQAVSYTHLTLPTNSRV